MAMDSAARRQLFIELASREGGATANDVHAEARARGDDVATIEAYHNLGRRLTRSGRLVILDDDGPRKIYYAKEDDGGTWIDEDYIQSIVDPEHPMESLVVLREASRQLRTIPPAAWAAAAAILERLNAREAAVDAITAYAEDLVDHLDELARMHADKASYLPADIERITRRCEGLIEMLVSLCRNGLGLSRDAIFIPLTADAGMRQLVERGHRFVDRDLLVDEISRRIEDVSLLSVLEPPGKDHGLIVAGVDGSTQGGLLSIDGTAGDYAFGSAPQITLNTAAAVLNRRLRLNNREVDVFLRFPSAPEDIQRKENTYTIMSPMFHPDLSPVEYMHSSWNAMDVLECRAARAALDTWTTNGSDVEVQPADVVIRDGTIVPNDRDPSHYAQPDTYGRIVREMVNLNWEMAKKTRDEAQTVAGAVKHSQVRVIGPIMNFVIAAASGTPETNLTSWALDDMNAISDQQLLSRLLSHAKKPKGHWMRSAIVMRPFHATTPAYSRYYERDPARAPARQIEKRITDARDTPAEQRMSDQHGWAEMRIPNSYSQMLDSVRYAGFYANPGVVLEKGLSLPRLEMLIPGSTAETGGFPEAVSEHLGRLLAALATDGFSVAADHAMFGNKGTIDFAPLMLQRAHEIVNGFAKEMKLRAGEFMDRLLSREIKDRRRQKVSVRPWTLDELRAWKERVRQSRTGEEPPARMVGRDG